MFGRDSSRSTEATDASFRLAVGSYVGVLVAGVAAVVVTATGVASTGVLVAAVAGFLSGCLVGVVAVPRAGGLAAWLGRTRYRRATVGLPAASFGAVVVASFVAPFDPGLRLVALGSGTLVVIAGSVLGWVARTRYVDAVTAGEPMATWHWDPPSSPTLDAILLLAWLSLGAGNASAGNSFASIVWTGLAILWLCSGLAEGRWRPGSLGTTPEIRVHDAGLVKQRPFTRTIVPWSDVSHVRLREDELVLDRGPFDVRFDRDELADLEGVRAEIERRFPTLTLTEPPADGTA